MRSRRVQSKEDEVSPARCAITGFCPEQAQGPGRGVRQIGGCFKARPGCTPRGVPAATNPKPGPGQEYAKVKDVPKPVRSIG